MLKIHNSLSRQKETFQPIQAGRVRMYVCGLTVYDYCHIGHARMLVVFDMVARWLRVNGYKLTYVRNITDIDDKIIRRAGEKGEPVETLTSRFIAAMHEDAAALHVLPPDVEPRATQSIAAIVRMVETLVKRDYAYQGTNGDVYYAVNRFRDYGRLSGKKPEELRAGARVEVDEAKRDPLDFVLWKTTKPGEPSWPSPWGPGRPGWHIECSAMSTAALGNHFDIHGGGMDLQFPHHENEIAQSEAASGEPFVNVWMHNGFVNIDDEKMSKSLGNFFTVRKVLKQYQPEVVRYFILNSHYRSPLNYSGQSLEQARAGLGRLYIALRNIPPAIAPKDAEYCVRFTQAMDDDFNTPVAISVLFDLAREINTLRNSKPEEAAALATLLKELGGMLGILQDNPNDYLQWTTVSLSGHSIQSQSGAGHLTVTGALSEVDIDALIEKRNVARREKNWKEADRLRMELDAAGIIIEDSASGTTWRRSSRGMV